MFTSECTLLFFFPLPCYLSPVFLLWCFASPVNILPALTLPSWLPVWDAGGLKGHVRAAFPLDAKLYSCPTSQLLLKL